MRLANPVQGSSALTINQAALFFDLGGRPGPRRRLRRRRPFFARGAVETLPSSDWIAARTSCCTMSRITVNKLLRLGIESPCRRQIHECPITSKGSHRVGSVADGLADGGGPRG
jgi:hypothetical protein